MSDGQRFDISQFGDEIKRILVVAAHPDDLETTSGGTLALLIGRGIEVALLLGTDGDIGTHDLSFTGRRWPRCAGRRRWRARPRWGSRTCSSSAITTGSWSPTWRCAPRWRTSIVAGSPTRFLPSTRPGAGRRIPTTSRPARAAVDAYMPSKMELYHPEQLGNGVRVADVKRFFFFGGSNRRGRDHDRHLKRLADESWRPPAATSASSARRKRHWNGWPRGTTRRGSAAGWRTPRRFIRCRCGEAGRRTTDEGRKRRQTRGVTSGVIRLRRSMMLFRFRQLPQQLDCMWQHRRNRLQVLHRLLRAARQVDDQRAAADAGDAPAEHRVRS